VVKTRFDRLLKEVQHIAAESVGKDCGKVLEALVEEVDSHQEGYVTGRLSNNVMVHFPGGKELIGQVVSVRLEESKGFYYMGTMQTE
jgi:tRNA-2-methylthio-N6-dimethylallyladenosine synthase